MAGLRRLGGEGRRRRRGGRGEKANLTTKALLRSVGCSLVVVVAVAPFVFGLRKGPHEMGPQRSYHMGRKT